MVVLAAMVDQDLTLVKQELVLLLHHLAQQAAPTELAEMLVTIQVPVVAEWLFL
jgi:hypothetical protein